MSLRRHDESTEKENSRRLVTSLGLDGKTISPGAYRREGDICLDIPLQLLCAVFFRLIESDVVSVRDHLHNRAASPSASFKRSAT